MPCVTKGWPLERRKAQAERARKTKPWTQSTGPRSAEGKSRSRLNGVTHGLNTQAARILRDALRGHQASLTTVIPDLIRDPEE